MASGGDSLVAVCGLLTEASLVAQALGPEGFSSRGTQPQELRLMGLAAP